jgi:hypothetical protein
MGMLRVLSRSGDDKYSWSTEGVAVGDPEALDAVREAERIFEEQRSRGATAIRVSPDRPAERLDTFDPLAEQIVMIPRVIGG